MKPVQWKRESKRRKFFAVFFHFEGDPYSRVYASKRRVEANINKSGWVGERANQQREAQGAQQLPFEIRTELVTSWIRHKRCPLIRI